MTTASARTGALTTVVAPASGATPAGGRGGGGTPEATAPTVSRSRQRSEPGSTGLRRSTTASAASAGRQRPAVRLHIDRSLLHPSRRYGAGVWDRRGITGRA